VATFILLPDNEATNPQELFVAHFELPVASNVRSEGSVEVWNRAITSFNEKNYDQYIEDVSPLFENEAFAYRNQGYIFLGLSHLQLGNVKAALSAFDQVSRISASGEDAEWYNALSP
jgi:hypothetical protein